MITFTQVFNCGQCEIYQTIKGQKKYIAVGELKVLIDKDTEVILMFGDICYGVTNDLEMFYHLYQSKDGYFIILDLPKQGNSLYQLIIKNNIEILLSCIGQKCKVNNKGQIKQEVMTPSHQIQKQKAREHQELIQQKIGIDQQEGKKNVFVQLSKSLGTGIYLTGKLLSKGIVSIGGFISNRVQKNEKPIQVSQNTKNNFKKLSELSGNLYDITSTQMKKLLNFGKQLVLDVTGKLQSSSSGKKVIQHQYFRACKDGAMTGFKVFINVYDGVVQAGNQVKNGALEGSRQVLKKKFGQQIDETFMHFAGGVNNVYKIYKIPKDEVKQLFRPQKNIQKIN